MSQLLELVGKRIEKKVKFMGIEVTISKLSVAEVIEIQEKSKELQKEIRAAQKAAEEGAEVELDESGSLEVLKLTLSRSLKGGLEGISDEDLRKLPLAELQDLAEQIMKFSGVSAAGK